MGLDGNILSKSTLNQQNDTNTRLVDNPQTCLNTKVNVNYSITMISYVTLTKESNSDNDDIVYDSSNNNTGVFSIHFQFLPLFKVDANDAIFEVTFDNLPQYNLNEMNNSRYHSITCLDMSNITKNSDTSDINHWYFGVTWYNYKDKELYFAIVKYDYSLQTFEIFNGDFNNTLTHNNNNNNNVISIDSSKFDIKPSIVVSPTNPLNIMIVYQNIQHLLVTPDPTQSPIIQPTKTPVIPSTMFPSEMPSPRPSDIPSNRPSMNPTIISSNESINTTLNPTSNPLTPTTHPSPKPTNQPTGPTLMPTFNPTFSPTDNIKYTVHGKLIEINDDNDNNNNNNNNKNMIVVDVVKSIDIALSNVELNGDKAEKELISINALKYGGYVVFISVKYCNCIHVFILNDKLDIINSNSNINSTVPINYYLYVSDNYTSHSNHKASIVVSSNEYDEYYEYFVNFIFSEYLPNRACVMLYTGKIVIDKVNGNGEISQLSINVVRYDGLKSSCIGSFDENTLIIVENMLSHSFDYDINGKHGDFEKCYESNDDGNNDDSDSAWGWVVAIFLCCVCCGVVAKSKAD